MDVRVVGRTARLVGAAAAASKLKSPWFEIVWPLVPASMVASMLIEEAAFRAAIEPFQIRVWHRAACRWAPWQ
jgi:hypothetical protein